MQDLARDERQVNEGSSAEFKGQLFDAGGDPIASTDITTLLLTLIDLHSGATINGRSAQNVNNANGVSLPAALTITGATQANPVVITTSAVHQLERNMTIRISGVGGMTELNGRRYRVVPISDTTFALSDIDGTGFTAYTSGGTVAHGLLIWTLDPADNAAVGVAISGATQADPVVITTATPHRRDEGEEVNISGVVGMTELNGRRFTVRPLTYNTFELVGEDGTGHTAYGSAGTILDPHDEFESHLATFDGTFAAGAKAVTARQQIDVRLLQSIG